jgi:hypothetical protein
VKCQPRPIPRHAASYLHEHRLVLFHLGEHLVVHPNLSFLDVRCPPTGQRFVTSP